MKHYWRHFKAGKNQSESWELTLSRKNLSGFLYSTQNNEWNFDLYRVPRLGFSVRLRYTFTDCSKRKAMQESVKAIIECYTAKERLNNES